MLADDQARFYALGAAGGDNLRRRDRESHRELAQVYGVVVERDALDG